MHKRIAVGFVSISALLMFVMLDAFIAGRAEKWGMLPELLRRGSVIPILFTLTMVAAAQELAQLLRRVHCNPHTVIASIWVAVLMLSPWLSAGQALGDAPADVEGYRWQVIWMAAAFISSATWHLRRGVCAQSVTDFATTIFIVFYLGLLPSYAIMLRCSSDVADPHDGAWYIFIVLAIAFATDVLALFGGMVLGKNPLAPKISPKKTIEGAVSGVLGTILFSFILYALAKKCGPGPTDDPTFLVRLESLLHQITAILDRMTLLQMGIFAGTLSILVQVGDLFESALKRSAQVKDSSAVIPGMGGFLDVIDGVLFAIPGAWFLLFYVWELV